MSRLSNLERSRLAFAFPGVGVKLCGHEAAFFARHEAQMSPLIAEASSYARCDFVDLLHDVDEQSQATELQGQLFTYAFDSAVAVVFTHHGLRPSVMAGHSMGLYSALHAAGVIDFGDGLRIVEQAYRLVTEASAGLDCGMAVVVGLARQEVEELIAGRPSDDSVCLVNSNNDTTKVFAGLTADLESFLNAAMQREALRAMLLPVSAPYHHGELLADVSRQFEQYLRRFSWSDADRPIISSLDQNLLTDADGLRDFTANNLSTPIDWEKVTLTMIDEGTELVLECGAGLSLTQNGRFVPHCPPFVNVKNARRRVGL